MLPILRAMDRCRARLVYQAQEAMLRRPTFALLKELARSDTWSREQLESLQAVKLNVLLQTALAHSPWHAARMHDAGIAARAREGAVTLADLHSLPTMDKQDARENIAQLVWKGVPGGAYRYNTGGSSGEPLIFYFGRARQAADAASRMRARRWWEVEPGDREAYLWGAPTELRNTDRLKRLRDAAVNHRVLNAFRMTASRMDDYLAQLESWQPRCIYGYASSLALLAAHSLARQAQLALPDLRVVCTTGEPLFPHQRTLIEKAFSAPVANEYGCRDGGLVAHEAPGGVMRVMSESIIVELLGPAGEPVGPGQRGEVALTHLASFAQPFIRYRTGDHAVAAHGDAGRGGVVHALSGIEGRSTDFVVAVDGTVMHALAVIYEIRNVEGVGAFKCIQPSISEFIVQIVPTVVWSDHAGAQIEAGLRARLGEGADIRIDLVAEIPPEASGKHCYVVSHVTPSPATLPA